MNIADKLRKMAAALRKESNVAGVSLGGISPGVSAAKSFRAPQVGGKSVGIGGTVSKGPGKNRAVGSPKGPISTPSV